MTTSNVTKSSEMGSSRSSTRCRRAPTFYSPNDDAGRTSNKSKLRRSSRGKPAAAAVEYVEPPTSESDDDDHILKVMRPNMRIAQPSPNKTRQSRTTVELPEHRTPPWVDLPAELLVKIFKYCYEPGESAWMLDLANHVCKVFAEPALTALYDSPITHETPPHRVTRLKVTLRRDWTTHGSPRYGSRVHRLLLPHIPRGKAGAALLLDLHGIIDTSPNITFVALPPNASPSRAVSFDLASLLFLMGRIKCCHWEAWSFMQSLMALNPVDPLNPMGSSDRPFRSLERLYLEANSGELGLWPLDRSMLPSLKHLSITFDTLPDPAFDWSLIPRSLSSLELIGINEDSTNLLAYLLQPAVVDLLELRLTSALYGDMSFLASLDQLCPQLQRFHLDLAPFRPDPIRPPLEQTIELSDSIRFAWPATLQEVTLHHLQWADTAGAEILFQSLIDSAPRLKDLRSIDIKVHLTNTSWHDRRFLRKKWTDRFAHVYSRYGPGVVREQEQKPPRSLRSVQQTRQSGRRRMVECDSDSSDEELEDDESLPRQGLCDKVVVNIDNQRPRGIEMTEENFLDSEPSDDDDWED